MEIADPWAGITIFDEWLPETETNKSPPKAYFMHGNQMRFFIHSDGHASIDSYFGDSPELTIPSEFEGHCITTLDVKTFKDCSSLVTVNIAEGITTIEYGCFSNCVNLTAVNLPRSLARIARNAFSGCTSLQRITLPSGLRSLEDAAFESCSSLRSVLSYVETAPHVEEDCFFRGLTDEPDLHGSSEMQRRPYDEPELSVGKDCFAGTPWLENGSENGWLSVGRHFIYVGKEAEIRLPSSARSVDLSSARSFLEHVSVPEGFTFVEQELFSACSSLTRVELPGSILDIRRGSFSGCTSLQTVIIPDRVNLIGPDAFSGCTGLRKITIPSSVCCVESGTFSGCTSLREVKNMENVKVIKARAFADCKNLQTLTLPNGVRHIEENAFSGTDVVLRVTPNSEAERYALFSGHKFILAQDSETGNLNETILRAEAVPLGERSEHAEADAVVSLFRVSGGPSNGFNGGPWVYEEPKPICVGAGMRIGTVYSFKSFFASLKLCLRQIEKDVITIQVYAPEEEKFKCIRIKLGLGERKPIYSPMIYDASETYYLQVDTINPAFKQSQRRLQQKEL